MGRKGIFALEELGEEIKEAVVIDESAGAEDLVDAQEHLEAAEEIEEAADAATDTVDALGEIRKEVGNSLAEGGMSEPEARALEVAVEHMCMAIGMPKKQVFPAMEGFADKKDRIHTTKLAMESIGEKAKEIGQRILKALAAAYEYAKKFFTSLFNAVEGLKSKADQIVAAAKQAPAGTGDASSVSGGFLKLLTVDGSYQVGPALLAAYKKHVTEPIIKEDRMSLIREIAPIMEKALADKDAATANAAVEEAFDKTMVGSKSEEQGEATVFEEPLVFAGQSYYQSFGGGKVSVKIAPSSAAKEVGELKEAPALDVKIIGELAGAVSAQMDAYKALGKDVQVLGGQVNAIIQKVKASMAGEGSISNDIYSQIQSLNNLTVVGSKLLRSYDVKVSSAILEYCVKSLKAIPKAEKAEKVEEVKPA